MVFYLEKWFESLKNLRLFKNELRLSRNYIDWSKAFMSKIAHIESKQTFKKVN